MFRSFLIGTPTAVKPDFGDIELWRNGRAVGRLGHFVQACVWILVKRKPPEIGIRVSAAWEVPSDIDIATVVQESNIPETADRISIE